MAKDKATKKTKKTKSNGAVSTMQMHMFFVFSGVMAIAFLPTTVILLVGMIPTIVSFLTGGAKGRIRALTVGAMNLAGCTPFLFELWSKGHDFERAVTLLSNPGNIVMIYGAAAIGYMINWSLSGIVSSAIVQKSRARVVKIDKRHEALVERWGQEVTGELPLDSEGFPLAQGGDRKDI